MLRPGDGYEIRNDDVGETSGPFHVLAIDEDPSFDREAGRPHFDGGGDRRGSDGGRRAGHATVGA